MNSARERQIGLITKALEEGHPTLPSLLEGLLVEALLPPTAVRNDDFLKDLQLTLAQRARIGTPAIQVTRFKDSVQDLVRDPKRLAGFNEELERYRKAWNHSVPELSEPQKTGNRESDIAAALRRHKHATSVPGAFGVPTATFFDIFNRSTLGAYVSDDRPAVRGESGILNSDFHTLCLCSFWREQVGKHAVNLAKRLSPKQEQMTLVMLGDGAGDLGASLSESLNQAGVNFRIVHIDISPAMLSQQKLRYQAAGVDDEKILSISGNLLRSRLLLRDAIPDLDRAFFVMHEIFDDLRCHAVWSDYQGAGEMCCIFNNGRFERTLGLNSPDKLITKLPYYLPFYGNNSSQQVIRGFCPESIILIRELMGVCEHSAMYVGDYAGEFIANKLEAPKKLPYRVYGQGIKDTCNYEEGLRHVCSITADVNPSVLYFAEAFGGAVDFIGSQAEFIGQVSPEFAANIDQRIEKTRAIFAGEKAVPIREYMDAFMGTQMFSPTMFAGIVTKNC
jgi:hypothetical protein